MRRSDVVESGNSFEAVLNCPCGSGYLHHGAVQLYSRDEDAMTGRHAVVTDLSIHVDADMTGNTSPRRGSIRIEFRCELCDAAYDFCLFQHKGQTFTQWMRR